VTRRALRAPAIALAIAAAAACGGPRFHRIGPAPEPGPSATPISIDRIELAWSNAYLVRRGEVAVLVDSGSPRDRAHLAEALAARGVPPGKLRAVVVTHAHADHAGCARWLQTQGAAIVLGAGDAGPAGRGHNDRLRPTGLLGALLAPVFMFPFEPFTPDVAVDREIDLAAYGFPELRVVPVAGHTPGSVAVLLGSEAFTGDMVKGGELLQRSPTEHLYQTDRAADHRELEGLLARGVTRLYLGHSGPLRAADVSSWLSGAGGPYRATALSLSLDARGERADGGDLGATGGLRARYIIGRAGAPGLGYAAGADLRAGYQDGGLYEADALPLGLAARSSSGALLLLAAGAGIGGARGAGATHALVELAAELPAGPTRLFARAAAGWRLGGPAYAGDAGISDELAALAGLRLGGDHRWGDYVAGKGPFLAISYRNLGGASLLGIALGIELFAGR
jgi:glyoxylase-like metal-dependent hydrolase (beta-lactamase superfamily II)